MLRWLAVETWYRWRVLEARVGYWMLDRVGGVPDEPFEARIEKLQRVRRVKFERALAGDGSDAEE